MAQNGGEQIGNSDFGAVLVMLTATAPIVGAVASAPMVGSTLVVLGLLDSFLLGFGIW